MNVKRQYSLPNCTLTLEGLSTDLGGVGSVDARPTLTLLTLAQCQFMGSKKILHGGKTFLENLVRAVSTYAQECLSGVRQPRDNTPSEDHIHLEPNATGGHRLLWYPAPDAQEPESPVIVNLSTVQLFDLVEAVDQFMSDSRTLPDLNFNLQPVSRRYRQADEPAGKKALPLALGLGSLALSALALYFLPMPEVRMPERPAVVPSSPTPSPDSNLPGP